MHNLQKPIQEEYVTRGSAVLLKEELLDMTESQAQLKRLTREEDSNEESRMENMKAQFQQFDLLDAFRKNLRKQVHQGSHQSID
jgi:hypothetical protein